MRNCNGVCERYKKKHPIGKSWYATGLKRCGTCQITIDWADSKCPCCKSKLRTNSIEKKSNDDKRY